MLIVALIDAKAINLPAPNDPIAITGMGCLSCAGSGVESLWQAALTREIHVDLGPSAFEAYPTCGIAEIPIREDVQRLVRKGDRLLPLALHAAHQAWQDAGLSKSTLDRERCGVIAGTSRGPIQRVIDLVTSQSSSRPRLSSALHSIHSCLSGTLAMYLQARGPALTVSSACTSGAVAIGLAAEQLMLGKADVMIAGAAEAPLTPFVLRQMAAAGFLGHDASDPKRACRPFDRSRNGTIVGEGAGFMVLERQSDARARNATILGILSGWSFASEAEHRATPNLDGHGLQQVAGQALRQAGLTASDVAWINTHGTGTHANDLAESRAIRGLKMQDTPCTSTKPITGHCLGATAALEAILCVHALSAGQLPPTANLRDPDPCCAINVLKDGPVSLQTPHTLSLSQAFWGKTAALAFSATHV